MSLRLLRKATIGAVVVGGLLGTGSLKFVRDAYPADPFKSDALLKCLANDPGFIRFSAEQRARCYARQPHQTLGFISAG